MAYVDTPDRLHKVTRNGDVFEIEYGSLKYVAPETVGAEPPVPWDVIAKQFEKQGIFRALRQAGAKPGDRIRLFGRERVLEDIVDRPRNWLPESDGIKGYTYIETEPIGRLGEERVTALAAELLPSVIKKLVA